MRKIRSNILSITLREYVKKIAFLADASAKRGGGRGLCKYRDSNMFPHLKCEKCSECGIGMGCPVIILKHIFFLQKWFNDHLENVSETSDLAASGSGLVIENIP